MEKFRNLLEEQADQTLIEGITAQDFLDGTIERKSKGLQKIAKIQGKEIEYQLGKKNSKGGISALGSGDDESTAEVIMVVLPSGKMAMIEIK